MSVVKSPSPEWFARVFLATAVAYVVAALVAAWLWSPRVPYADAWRHYARLIDQPFADGVLAADNGHPEVFANLVRWISLHVLGGNEDGQILIGLFLALATLAVLLRTVWTSRDLSFPQRAAVTLVLALGLFWLGNARALLHDNDSLHVYSVLVCLALAIACMGDRSKERLLTRTVSAAALCVIASFNFGSGIASFLAVFELLFVDRASRQRHAIVGAALVIALLGYRWLAGSIDHPALQPVEQTVVALRWLAAPLIYLFWPFLDPAAAAMLPRPLNGVGYFAAAWTARSGGVHVSIVPQAVCGALFLAGVVRSTLRARHRPSPARVVVSLGLGLAWFGVGISALVALSRVDYFGSYPTQIYAPRYLPWSSLAWAGWLVALVAERPRPRMLALVAAIALLAASAEVGMTLVMRTHRAIAEDNALAIVAGVWPTADRSGESEVRDIQVGAAAMRRLGVGPFAWPEANLIGHAPPANARPFIVDSWEKTRLSAAAGVDAWMLETVVADPPCAVRRLLVVDRGTVVGVMRRVGAQRWRGFTGTDVSSAVLKASALDCSR
jgi:hypothetical protein